jgi:toxin FitB
MTKYLLDTNVVSMLDPKRHQHAPAVVDWLDRNGAIVFLSVMTIAEMDSGVFKLRRDGKNARADDIAELISTILNDFSDRVLGMDVETARHAARLGSETYQQPVALPDMIIAATAARHDMVVLTRNLKDFRRLSVASIDPFVDLPADG